MFSLLATFQLVNMVNVGRVGGEFYFVTPYSVTINRTLLIFGIQNRTIFTHVGHFPVKENSAISVFDSFLSIRVVLGLYKTLSSLHLYIVKNDNSAFMA